MAENVSYRVTEIAKRYAKEWVKTGDVVLDATAGNGWDTLLLSELVGKEGKVYAFDIQKEAIEKARELVGLSENVEFVLDSHENLDKYVSQELDFAMFNLGFLPGGDRSITTTEKTSLEAIKKTMDRLKCNKALTICIYPGHEQGRLEGERLERFFCAMSSKAVFVLKTSTLNASNSPYCLLVIKRKGYPSKGRRNDGNSK